MASKNIDTEVYWHIVNDVSPDDAIWLNDQIDSKQAALVSRLRSEEGARLMRGEVRRERKKRKIERRNKANNSTGNS